MCKKSTYFASSAVDALLFYSKRFQTWKKRLTTDSVFGNLTQTLISKDMFNSMKSISQTLNQINNVYYRQALNIKTNMGKHKNTLLRFILQA